MSCLREQSAAEKSNTEQPRRKEEEEEEEREEEGRRRKKIKLVKLQWEDKGKRSTKEVEGRRKRRGKKQKMDVSSRTGGGLEQVYLVGWQWVGLVFPQSTPVFSIYTQAHPHTTKLDDCSPCG